MLRRTFLSVSLILSLPVASFAYESDGPVEQDGYLFIQVHPQPKKPLELQSGQKFDLNKQLTPPPKQLMVTDQIKRIDQEILILRAELAIKNGDAGKVRHYLEQLNRLVIFPEFKQRLAVVKQFLISGRSSERVTDSVSKARLSTGIFIQSLQPLDFPFYSTEAVSVVLLPMSGPYAEVGEMLFDSLNQALIKHGYQGTLTVFDSALYNSAYDLWQVVKMYQPSFIFGPLQKEMISQWHNLGLDVPTLYFNEVVGLQGHERSLSPSKSKGLEQVFSILNLRYYQKVLVLTDQSEASKKLEALFYQDWLTQGRPFQYEHQSIDLTVSQAIDVAMNAQRSRARKAWLQKLIGQRLEFTPRTRSDFDAVISFVPQNTALQVTPMLEFYQLNDVAHIWYPSKTPQIDSLQESLPSLQKTYAVLPAHIQSRLQQNDLESDASQKSGLFYALGQVAVEIVKNPAISNGMDLYVDTEFGAVKSNSVGQFYLLPIVYKIDQGALKIASEFSEVSPE